MKANSFIVIFFMSGSLFIQRPKKFGTTSKRASKRFNRAGKFADYISTFVQAFKEPDAKFSGIMSAGGLNRQKPLRQGETVKSELKLPRMVESDPRGPAIKELLSHNLKKLWAKAQTEAVFLPASEKFIKTLQLEHKRGRIVRGFESIERSLEIQAHGLSLIDEKTGGQRGTRVSRLLIISNDGAERFMRNVESLLFDHVDRVLSLVINIDSETLGQMFFGAGKTAKVMMLEHKESVANALFSLVDGEGSTSKPKPETKTPEKTGNSEKPWKEAVKARKKLIKTAKKSKKTSKK